MHVCDLTKQSKVQKTRSDRDKKHRTYYSVRMHNMTWPAFSLINALTLENDDSRFVTKSKTDLSLVREKYGMVEARNGL